jgi:serine/threonine-protein kinase
MTQAPVAAREPGAPGTQHGERRLHPGLSRYRSDRHAESEEVSDHHVPPKRLASKPSSCDGSSCRANPGRCSRAAPAAAPAKTTSDSATKGKPSNTDPAGAIAKCKDGTYSHAKGHSGACSNHGSVGEWLDEKK